MTSEHFFYQKLLSENINFDENKLRKLIHNFDKDNDFSLNLHEFISLIQSKKNKEKKEFLSNYKSIITDEIKNDFINILEKEMELITELNEIAKEIKNSENFSTYEAQKIFRLMKLSLLLWESINISPKKILENF